MLICGQVDFVYSEWSDYLRNMLSSLTMRRCENSIQLFFYGLTTKSLQITNFGLKF